MDKYRASIRRYGYCFVLAPLFMVTEASGEFILPYGACKGPDRQARHA